MTAHTRDELDILFGRNAGHEDSLDEWKKLPSMFGGDGMSLENPLFVNCASGALAERLIKRFIISRHGKEGGGWKLVRRSIHVPVDNPDGVVEHYVIETLEGEKGGYYFDLSRVSGSGAYVLRQAYELGLLDEVDPERSRNQ